MSKDNEPRQANLFPQHKILGDIIYTSLVSGDLNNASFWLDVAHISHRQEMLRLTHRLEVAGLIGSYPQIIIYASEIEKYLSWKSDESRVIDKERSEYKWSDFNSTHKDALLFIILRGSYIDSQRKEKFNEWLYSSKSDELHRILMISWPLERAINDCYFNQGLHKLSWVKETHDKMTGEIFDRFLLLKPSVKK